MKKLGPLWFGSLLFKLLFSACLPLTTDEAYYWVWSQHPQLSYYDHPPMVAWLFRLGHCFEFFGSAVRWPGVLLGHCTLLAWFYIFRELFPDFQKKWQSWSWLVLFSPLLGFGSLIVTPDLPVILFWSLSLLYTLRVIKFGTVYDYSLLGLSLGCGFLSKYHIVLFVPLVLAYLTKEKKWAVISIQKSLLTVFFGLLFSSPVLIWNYQNHFESFLFQLHHGLGRQEYKFYWSWSYVFAQILVIFPLVFYRAAQFRPQNLQKILLYLGWGPLLFFFFSSFKGQVEVNWPIVAYPAIFALAVGGLAKSKAILVSGVFWSFLFGTLASHLLFSWIPFAPEKLSEFSQFRPILEIRSKYSPFYASTYQMASWTWYQSKEPFYKLNGMSRKDLFDDFSEGIPTQYPIYVAMKERTSLPDWVEEKKLRVVEVEKLPNDFVVIKISQQ